MVNTCNVLRTAKVSSTPAIPSVTVRRRGHLPGRPANSANLPERTIDPPARPRTCRTTWAVRRRAGGQRAVPYTGRPRAFGVFRWCTTRRRAGPGRGCSPARVGDGPCPVTGQGVAAAPPPFGHSDRTGQTAGDHHHRHVRHWSAPSPERVIG